MVWLVAFKQKDLVKQEDQINNMAEKGLLSWVKENWVDIANTKKDGSYTKCGRSGGEKR